VRIGITGISGSLGSALCAELVAAGIGPLVGTTRDEFKAEQIGNRYGGVGGQVRVMIAAEGINDTKKMEQIFRGCEVVVHAAALKRISGSVYAATEMIETNVNGTLSVIRAATNAGVSKVLVISSDKAVQATNLYGATKFIGECLAVQENSFSYPRGTRIACCRYGNVLGSRGSVLPIWREAMANGQPLLVTHHDMTRFLITMKEAVNFVMASIFSMKGGEIFVPLLPTATMVDLATAVAGGKVDVLVKNELRPGGEKLAEALLSEEEPVRTVHRTLHGGFSGGIDSYAVLPSHRTWSSETYPGIPVAHDLIYRSDTVERRLTVDELRLLL
jgi:UDP-N-acetylglucosamine 4,6-dehydratase